MARSGADSLDGIQYQTSTHKNLLSTSYQFCDRIRVVNLSNDEYNGQPAYANKPPMKSLANKSHSVSFVDKQVYRKTWTD